MSTSEDEIREYLESKKLKEITLPENTNDIDQGGAAKEEKIGQKSSLARIEYVMDRDRKMQAGDKLSIAEFMTEQTEIRQKLRDNKKKGNAQSMILSQEEKKRLAKESKITEEDRQNEKEDIEKLERKREGD